MNASKWVEWSEFENDVFISSKNTTSLILFDSFVRLLFENIVYERKEFQI